MEKIQYRIITINEERIPLADGTPMEYFGGTIAVMLFILVLFAGIMYILSCNKYRKRIGQLDMEGRAYKGWNLGRLKETVVEIEMDKTRDIESYNGNIIEK